MRSLNTFILLTTNRRNTDKYIIHRTVIKKHSPKTFHILNI
nr:MAG TPA: hypothetical protein [Caudoviricetes sp.]